MAADWVKRLKLLQSKSILLPVVKKKMKLQPDVSIINPDGTVNK